MMNKVVELMKSMVNEKDLVNIITNYTDEPLHSMDFTAHLESWAENKAHIFKLFGNKFTIEREVEAALPSQLISHKLDEFLNKDFDENKYSLIKVFLKALSPEEIQINVLNNDFVMFDTTFKKGMKISKCFKQLIKKNYLEEANIKYSMYLQSLKAKGIAVLSIDPKDFLTMSANASGWRSCHAPDGEYRVGNIAYMMDNCSVISYIKATDNVEIPGGTVHTNKIWRQIVLISPENKYAIQCRQYPNNNDSNVHTIALMLREALKDSVYKTTGKDLKYDQIKCDVEDNLFSELQECHNDYNQCYYNDIYHEAFDYGYLVKPECESLGSLNEKVYNQHLIEMPIVGAEVPCLSGNGEILEGPEYYFKENCYGYDDDDDDYDYDYDED